MFVDMTVEELQRYHQEDMSEDQALARSTTKRKESNDLAHEIRRTISRRRIRLIQSDDTTYSRLKRLNKHLYPLDS